MLQLNKQTTLPSQILHTNDEETFIYNGSTVKIITVFNDKNEATALIEDENGEIFQVPRNSLR